MEIYIDREEALKKLTQLETDKSDFTMTDVKMTLIGVPLADVVVVTRCKDCVHHRELTESEKLYLAEGALICTNTDFTEDGWNPVWPEDFCSYGGKES